MFIARISRGRTIRQFVAGVVLIPSAVSLLWFAVFGGAAIATQRSGIDLASRPIEGQLFGLLDTLPLGGLLGIVAGLAATRRPLGGIQPEGSLTAVVVAVVVSIAVGVLSGLYLAERAARMTPIDALRYE
jgi:ABC-type antimicrobial peptide transport system permease subunit